MIVTTAIQKLAGLTKKFKVIRGGKDAGKTIGILAILINKAINGEEYHVVSHSMPHLKLGALKDFKELMLMTDRWDERCWNATDKKYTFWSGGVLWFYSVEDIGKARGPRRDGLYINECDKFAWALADALFDRTRYDIWLDFNPVGEFWADTRLKGQKNVDFITLTYKDNESLSEEAVNEIEEKGQREGEYWSNWWRVYGLGLPGSLEGACIPEWSMINELPRYDNGELECRVLGHGLDFGYTNDPSSLITKYKWNDQVIYDEVFYKKGMLNSDISDEMKANEVSGYIYADSAEPKSIAELVSRGHEVYPVKKGQGSIQFGLNLMNQEKINVTKRSTNLISELRRYVYVKDKSGEKTNKPLDAYNHSIDAARYITMGLKEGGTGNYSIFT